MPTNHFLPLSQLWYIIFLMLPTQILVFIATFEKGVKFDLGAPFVHIVRHYENQGCLGAPCTIEKENKIERTSPASWAGKNMSKF